MHLAHCVILALSTMPASACVEDMEWTDEEKAALAASDYAATGPAGPPTGAVAYPYYTTRGPRDFLAKNPASIGPQ